MMLARAQIAVVAVLVPAIMCMRVAKVPRVPPGPLPLPNGAAGPRDVHRLHVRHTTPEEYGAKGDGVSNDWGPILAAVGSCKGYTTCTVTFAQHYLSGPIQVWQWRPAWLWLTSRTPHGVSRVLACRRAAVAPRIFFFVTQSNVIGSLQARQPRRTDRTGT